MLKITPKRPKTYGKEELSVLADAHAYTKQRAFEAIEMANALCRTLDWACDLDPEFAVDLEAQLLAQERQLRGKLEMLLDLYPGAQSGSGNGSEIQRVASITTGLGLTTQFLNTLRFTFKRAHRREAALRVKAERQALEARLKAAS